LSCIIITSKKAKERNEAIGLKNKMESFTFVLLLVIQVKVLEKINITSKLLQSITADLMKTYSLLENVLMEVVNLCKSFKELVLESSEICLKWGIPNRFPDKRIKKVRKHFNKLCEDERLTDSESRFKVTVFYPMLDIIFSQVNNRFKGMKNVLDNYKVIQPHFLARSTDTELREEAEKFAKVFSEDVSPLFPSQLMSVRTSFRHHIKNMDTVKQLADLLMIQHSSLTSSFSDVCTALFMFLTVPVTVATAERTFSKLRIIKNYLRSTMSQERLSGLALLSIENDRAQKLDFNKIIDIFATEKSRKKYFY
jgi:hypothetical protein